MQSTYSQQGHQDNSMGTEEAVQKNGAGTTEYPHADDGGRFLPHTINLNIRLKTINARRRKT